MIKRVVALLILISVILYIVIKTVEGFKQNQASFNEDLPITYTILPEDSALIRSDCIRRIKVVQVHNSKVRSPVSEFILDNKYPLFIYKVDSSGRLSLKDSFIVKNIDADRTTGVTYNILKENFYKFQYKSGNVNSTSSIFLTIKGDSLQQTIRSDTLIGFNVLCDNSSIRYGKNKAIDIFIEGKQKGVSTMSIPMSILFYKRNKNTYLLILTANNPNSPIPRGILQSILSL